MINMGYRVLAERVTFRDGEKINLTAAGFEGFFLSKSKRTYLREKVKTYLMNNSGETLACGFYRGLFGLGEVSVFSGDSAKKIYGGQTLEDMCPSSHNIETY